MHPMANDTPRSKKGNPLSATCGESSVEQKKTSFWPIFTTSNQRMSCCCTLMEAAKNSHLGCTEWHLKYTNSRAELFRRQCVQVPKPLHEAAGAKPTPADGHKPSCTLCVEAMLDAGADSSWLDERGRSPLQRAAMVGCVSCIEALLRSPTTKVDTICDSQSTALIEAVRINCVEAVRALIAPPSSASIKVLADDYKPRGPLVEAVKAGAYECIAPLAEAGAPLNPVPCTHGQKLWRCHACVSFPLLVAATQGAADKEDKQRTSDILRLLVKLGADVGAKCTGPFRGQSALHVSASKGRCNSLKVLLELGADPMALDIDGDSPLHLAAASSNAEACELLTKHIMAVSGAEEAAVVLVAKGKEGKTPLHCAVSSGRWNGASEAALCLSMLLSLLEESGGPQAVAGTLRETSGENGRNIVHLAAEQERVDFLKVLTETPEGLRTALDSSDIAGLTPVAHAQRKGHDFDDIPAFAQVPLVPCCDGIFEAVENGHVTCVKNILKSRDLPNAERSVAFTPQGKHSTDLLATVPHGCHLRCAKITRALLEAGFDPDGLQGDSSPLRHAVDVDNTEGDLCEVCTRLLIEAGASGLFSCKREDGDSVMWAILEYASYNGDKSQELTRAALATCDLKYDEDGVTHICHWAGKGYNFELPRLLAEAGANIKAKTAFGETVLHIATELLQCEDSDFDEEDDGPPDSAEHAELVKWLVSKGATVDEKDNAGRTPLHVAVKHGFGNVLSQLLDLGANPLLRDDNGDTALHIAARASSTTMVARLIDLGIGVNIRNNDAATALHLASTKGSLGCVRILLEEGGNINAKTKDGSTPLRCAARAYDSSVLMYLLDTKTSDPGESHGVLGSLLHSAARSGSTAAMQLLVDRGLDMTSIISGTGETVMHMAAQSGLGGAVKWLLGKGISLDVRDSEGREPPISAVVKGSGRDWEVLSVLQAIARSARGGNGLRAIFRGRSLIHWASGFGLPLCVKFLIRNGAGVDSKTIDGDEESAMHCAARYDHKSVVRTLAEAGARMDIRDATGMTPLHDAASKENLEIVALLLDFGASCDIADEAGATPLATAAKKGYAACCSLLIARGADMTLRDIHGRNALGSTLDGGQDLLHNIKECEAVIKLLLELGCPVGEPEVDAASRGPLTRSFAEAIMARMSSCASARQLAMATSKVSSAVHPPASLPGELGKVCCGQTLMESLTIVRLTRTTPPIFSKRRLLFSAVRRVNSSSKVYRVDGSGLRNAVVHLEGPEEAKRCPLLKLLLPRSIGWGASYREVSAQRSIGVADHPGRPPSLSSHPAEPTAETEPPESAAGPAPSAVVRDGEIPNCSQPTALLATEVEISCNGDDFDEAGFEAVIEYLVTGQVVGATCGSIHGDASASSSDTTLEIGLRAIATHRAAAFFGLPRLQSSVRDWLKVNGVEMEDDGTGVLCETVVPKENSGDGSKKRKFEAAHSSSDDDDADDPSIQSSDGEF